MPFFAPPPTLPEPEPEPELKTYVILAVLVISALLAGYAYLKARWPVWFAAAAEAAFKEVDRDGSGSIDKEELYTCVLWLYLTLNEYGLKVCAPDRETVDEIMRVSDVDGSGALEMDEFKRALDVLTAQTLGRATTQLVFTLLCPPAAATLIEGVGAVWGMLLPGGLFPTWLQEVGGIIPESVPVLVLSALLMLLLPLGLSQVAAAPRLGLEPQPPAPLVTPPRRPTATRAAHTRAPCPRSCTRWTPPRSLRSASAARSWRARRRPSRTSARWRRRSSLWRRASRTRRPRWRPR